MIKILVKENNANVSLFSNCHPYSIVNKVKMYLINGYNELEDLPYGFYFNHFCHPYFVKEIDLSEYDTSKIIDMASMFNGCVSLTKLNFNNFKTNNTIYLTSMFAMCLRIPTLDLSSFDTRNVIDMRYLFFNCSSLVSLDLSNFNAKNVAYMENMFYGCSSLKYIKCKQAFKDWCLENMDIIKLPSSMCNGGDGIWEIID